MTSGGRRFLAVAAMGCTLVSGTLFPRSAAAVNAPDFWPLVKCASGGVWGTLIEIQVAVDDRILVIDAAEHATSEVARGASVIRLLEHHGQLPEGTPLRPGDSGLFLFHDSPLAANVAANGQFVPAGLVRLSLASPARGILTRLVAGRGAEADRVVALELLRSPEPNCRAIALGWLREHADAITEVEQAELGRAFANEELAPIQNSFLELFLLEGIDLADGAAAHLLLREESPELLETSIRYLERFATTRDRAQLLQSFPDLSAERRGLLLEAYARIPIPEAWVWWEATLQAGDPTTLGTAIEYAAVGGYPNSFVWYDALLTSTNPAVRRVGLEGLATLRSTEAILRIRRFRSEAASDDPLRTLAEKLIKHPYRYSKPPKG